MEHLIKWLKENGYYEDYKKALKLPCNTLRNRSAYTISLYSILSATLHWAKTREATGIHWSERSSDFNNYISGKHGKFDPVLWSELEKALKESPYAKMIKFAKESHGANKKNT